MSKEEQNLHRILSRWGKVEKGKVAQSALFTHCWIIYFPSGCSVYTDWEDGIGQSSLDAMGSLHRRTMECVWRVVKDIEEARIR